MVSSILYVPILYTHFYFFFNQRSKDIDDPIVQRFMELEKAIDSELGVGFIEDKYPVLLKVWETRRMKKFKQVVEDFTNLVRDSWNNHHATFDAGEYSHQISTFVTRQCLQLFECMLYIVANGANEAIEP